MPPGTRAASALEQCDLNNVIGSLYRAFFNKAIRAPLWERLYRMDRAGEGSGDSSNARIVNSAR